MIFSGPSPSGRTKPGDDTLYRAVYLLKDLQAHDRPFLGSAGSFRETRLQECRAESGKNGPWIHPFSLSGFNGISFKYLPPFGPNKFCSTFYKIEHNTLAAVPGLYKKTGHRPYLLVIKRRQDAGTGKPREFAAGFDCHPANWNPIQVAQQSRDASRFHICLLCHPVEVAPSCIEILAVEFPVHAPASVTCAARPE